MDLEVEPMEDMRRFVEIDGKTIELNCEQAQVLDYTLEKVRHLENGPFHLFVSGPAGSGKTMLLKVIRNEIRQLHGEESCLVTASTEPSAEKLNCKTIDAAFLLLRHNGFEKLSKDEKKRLQKTMKRSKVLMIDVINFVTSTAFSMIDFRLQDILGVKKPFGGLSVLVFGDLLQMLHDDSCYIFRDIDPLYREQRDLLTPKSPKVLWSMIEMVELRENERLFIDNRTSDCDILDKIRSSDDVGFVHRELLKMCELENDSDFGATEATQLLLEHRKDNPNRCIVLLVPNEEMAEEARTNILASLGPVHSFTRQYSHDDENKIVEEDDLQIAIGCQIMLVIDLPEQNLVSGEYGIVEGFEDDSITVNFTSGTFNIQTQSQPFPLRLADVLTIEESQGMEFDGVIFVAKELWDSSEFSPLGAGHIYTALSRARSLKLCRISPLNSFGWKLSKNAVKELRRLEVQEEINENGMDINHFYLSEKLD